MAKPNPRVEALERENRMLRAQIDRMRQDPGECPFVACDNSCVVATPEGMAPNGGCRCDERKLRRAVQWYRMRCQCLTQALRHLDTSDSDLRNALERALPLLIRLGDFIGNAEDRCDVILAVRDALEGRR